MNRSRCVIRNFLQNLNEYNIVKRAGRKKILSDRDKRLILKNASNSTASCTNLHALVRNKVSKTTIWRTLNFCQHIIQSKIMKTPFLLAHHKQARIKFAEENISTNWEMVRYSFTLKKH